MTAELRRRLGHEEGFTLIEMLVALSVGTIVLLAAFALVDSALPTTKRILNRVDAEQRGRVALERMVRELRTAVCVSNGATPPTFTGPYLSATTTSLTFNGGQTGTANALSGPVTLALSGGAITEQAGAGPVRTLVTNAAPAGPSGALFSFSAYDASSNLGPVTPQSNGSIAASDLARVAYVSIAFTVQPTSATTYRGSDALLQDSVGARVGTDLATSDSTQKGPQCQI